MSTVNLNSCVEKQILRMWEVDRTRVKTNERKISRGDLVFEVDLFRYMAYTHEHACAHTYTCALAHTSIQIIRIIAITI